MNKCDFCPYSNNENGKIVCRYSICVLNNREFRELMEMLQKLNFRGKK